MSLLIVHVEIHVKPEGATAFEAATRANAAASLREPGIVRFDACRDLADPNRWVLVEIYRDEAAAAAHKQTAHYAAWRDAVAPFMAEPRSARRFVNVAPDDAGFGA